MKFDSVVLYSLLVILFTCTVVSAQVAQVGDPCDPPTPLRSGLYAPHPSDCGQYLQCVHGSFLARPCPSGLHWSAFHVTCNWPAFANCQISTATADNVIQPFQGLD